MREDDPLNLIGQCARLPNGQKVIVEIVEGTPAIATVRRIDGQRGGTRAICYVSKLEDIRAAKQPK